MALRRPAGLACSVVKLFLVLSAALSLRGSPVPDAPRSSPIAFRTLASFFRSHGLPRAHSHQPIQRSSPEFWWMSRLSSLAARILLPLLFPARKRPLDCIPQHPFLPDLGLMGLDMLNLRVLSTSGTVKEQVQAQKVLKLLERGRHWVLVVLLLSNVVVNETLPIFLDSVLGGGAAAILISTALIVVFGEIIPQSVCVRYGLSIGAKSAPFVLALMYLEFPIAYPIAMLLDHILGHDEGTTYRKAELKTFVGLHRHIGTDGLNEDEVTIISAVLDLSEKTIVDIMTPIEDTFTLGEDSILDEETVTELVSQGYSRVPVHETGHDRNFIGMLLVKRLISYDPQDARPVRDFQLSLLPEGSPDMTCLEALNYFQQGRSHIMLVSSRPGEEGGALGVVSLEDVIEEMIGEEIIDETDQYVDVAHKIKVVRRPFSSRATTKGLAPLLKGAIEKRRSAAEGICSRSDLGDGDDHREGNALLDPSYAGLASALISHRSSTDTSSHGRLPRRSNVLDKVRIKGGENTPRRSVSETRKKASRPPMGHTRRFGEEPHSPCQRNGTDGEDTPLLNGHPGDALIPQVTG